MAAKLEACDMFKGDETIGRVDRADVLPARGRIYDGLQLPQHRHIQTIQEVPPGAIRGIYRQWRNLAFGGSESLFDRRYHRELKYRETAGNRLFLSAEQSLGRGIG